MFFLYLSMAKQWEDRERKKQQGSAPILLGTIAPWLERDFPLHRLRHLWSPCCCHWCCQRTPLPMPWTWTGAHLLKFSHLHWCQLLNFLLEQGREHWRKKMVTSPSVQWCFRSWSSTLLLLFTFQGSQVTAACIVGGIQWERRSAQLHDYSILCGTKIPPWSGFRLLKMEKCTHSQILS